MADYDIINPTTGALSDLNTVKNAPAQSDQADVLGLHEVQIKNFIYNYFSKIITDSASQPTIKAAALPSASFAAGTVRGSTSNTGTQQEIAQGTVGTADLRDAAVTAVKIADGAVTENKLGALAVVAAKIQNLTITAGQIANATITGAKMVAKTVDTAELADGAVEALQLNTDAVETAKIKDANVTPAKLANGSAAGQILISGTTPYVFAAKAVSGDATLDSTGKLTLASLGIVHLVEHTNAGTGGGSAGSTTWNMRGVSIAWTKIYDTVVTRGGSSYVSITSGQAPITLLAGTYIITASAPAYKTGLHQVRLARYNSTNTFQEAVWGSSADAPSAGNDQVRSYVEGMLTFAAGDYFKVEHYSTGAQATNGLGLPASSPATNGETTYEVYAQVKIQQVS